MILNLTVTLWPAHHSKVKQCSLKNWVVSPINWAESSFFKLRWILIYQHPKHLLIYSVQEEDVTIVHVDKQESNNPEAIMTSTPALFSTVASKRRANTSIFGEPLPTQEASSLRTLSKSRPQLFLPSTEPRPRPQPYSFPKNQPSFSVSAFGYPVPVSDLS